MASNTRNAKDKPTANKRPSQRAPKGVDKLWFDRQFEHAGLSQRQVAAKMGMDPAQLNRALKGTRRFQSHELDALAEAVGVSSTEVLAHTPYLLTDGVRVSTTPRRAVPTVGHVDGVTGRVSLDDEGAQGAGTRAALVIEGAPFLQGARLVFRPAEALDTSTRLERVGIVRLSDGTLWLRAIRPGFRPGTWDLGPALGIGSGRQDDADVESVLRVDNIIFAGGGGDWE